MGKFTLLRHAAVYGAANMLLQAAGLVLLPLYTRYLTPSDFGVLEILGRAGEVLMTCLLVSGIRQALIAFYQQSQTESERRSVAGSGLLILLAGCLLGSGLLLGSVGLLSRGLGIGDTNLTRLAVLAVLADPFWMASLTLMQARLESGFYLVATLTQFLVKVALCTVLVAGLGWGVAGVLTASLLTSGLYAFLLTGREIAAGMAWPTLRQVFTMLRFALPFLPGGLCFFLLNYGDRYFLFVWHGQAEVGTYALGYKLALAVGTLSHSPLQMVWGVHMYREARSPEAGAVFGRAFTRIVAAYILLGLGLCLFQDEVIHLLGGDAYRKAAAIILPITLAGLLQTAASLMDSGLYIRGRTGWKVGLTLSATAVTVLGYFLLIPIWGSPGAALATLLGFAFLAVTTCWVTQRIFPVQYEWGRLVSLFAFAAALWLVSRALPAAIWAWPVKAGLATLWPWGLWRFGLVSRDEKQYLFHLLSATRLWLRQMPARSEIRSQRSEVRDQRSEIRNQRSEVRVQESEVRGHSRLTSDF